MDNMHEGTLRANAMDIVPFPFNDNYLYGGVYLQIDLDLTNQENGEEVHVNDVIVLDGGYVAGNFAGTLYVPEGVAEKVNSAAAPNLEVRELPFESLAQIWRQPATD